jgi:hypothetical protein
LTRHFAAVVIGIGDLSTTLPAQTALPITVDQRVRVWTAAPAAITGRVVSMNANAGAGSRAISSSCP